MTAVTAGYGDRMARNVVEDATICKSRVAIP